MSDDTLSLNIDTSGVVTNVDKAVKSLDNLVTGVQRVESAIGRSHDNLKTKADVASLFEKSAKAAGLSLDSQVKSLAKVFGDLEGKHKELEGSIEAAYKRRLAEAKRMTASELLVWKEYGVKLAEQQSSVIASMSEKGVRKALRGSTEEGRKAIATVLTSLQTEVSTRSTTLGESVFAGFRDKVSKDFSAVFSTLNKRVDLSGLNANTTLAVQAFKDALADVEKYRSRMLQPSQTFNSPKEFELASLNSVAAAKTAAKAYSEIVGRLTTEDKEVFKSLGLSASMLQKLDAGSANATKSLRVLNNELRLTGAQMFAASTKNAQFDLLKGAAGAGDVSAAKSLAKSMIKAQAELESSASDPVAMARLVTRYGEKLLEFSSNNTKAVATAIVRDAEQLKEATQKANLLRKQAMSILQGGGSVTIAGKDVKFSQVLLQSTTPQAAENLANKTEIIKAQLLAAKHDAELLQKLEIQHGSSWVAFAESADVAALKQRAALLRAAAADEETGKAADKALNSYAKLDAKLKKLLRGAEAGNVNAAKSYVSKLSELKATLTELEGFGSATAVAQFKSTLSPKTLSTLETTSARDLDALVKDTEKKAAALRVASKAAVSAVDDSGKQLDLAFKRLSYNAKSIKDVKSIDEYVALVNRVKASIASGATNASLVKDFGSDAVNVAIRTTNTELRRLNDEKLKAVDRDRGLGHSQGEVNKLMNTGHNVVKGLTSAYGLLWLTWGPLVPVLTGAALSYGTKSVVSFGSQLEQTLTSIQALGGETTASISKLNKELLDMGSTSVQGPNELAKAVKVLTLAGLDLDKAQTALRATLNLSTAGEMDISKSAETLTAVSEAFGYSAESFSTVGDTLAKTAAVSLSSVDTMAESFRLSTVIAQQYKISLNEVALGLAALSSVGVRGSAAGTALRNFMSDVSGRTEKTAALIKQNNLEAFNKDTGEFVGLAAWAKKLKTAMAKYGADARRTLMNELYTERGGKVADKILSLSSDTNLSESEAQYIKSVREMTGKATNEFGKAATDQVAIEQDKFTKLDLLSAKIADSYGFSAIAAAQMNSTLASQWKVVSSAFETSALKAFESENSNVLSTVLNLRNTLASPEFVTALSNIASGFISVADAIASNLPLVASFVSAVGLTAGVTYPLAKVALPLLASAGTAASVGLAATGAAGVSAVTGLAAAETAAAGTGAAVAATGAGALAAGPLLLALGATVVILAGAYAMLTKSADEASASLLSAQKSSITSQNLDESIRAIEASNKSLREQLNIRRGLASENYKESESQTQQLAKRLEVERKALSEDEANLAKKSKESTWALLGGSADSALEKQVADRQANVKALTTELEKTKQLIKASKDAEDLRRALAKPSEKFVGEDLPKPARSGGGGGKSAETVDNEQLAALKRAFSAEESLLKDKETRTRELLSAQKTAKVIDEELYAAKVEDLQKTSFEKQLALLLNYKANAEAVLSRGNLTKDSVAATRAEIAAQQDKIAVTKEHFIVLSDLARLQKINELSLQVQTDLTRLGVEAQKRLVEQLKAVNQQELSPKDSAIYSARTAEVQAYAQELAKLEQKLVTLNSSIDAVFSDSSLPNAVAADALDNLEKSVTAVEKLITQLKAAQQTSADAAGSMAADVYDYTHSWEYGASAAVRGYLNNLQDTATRSKSLVSGMIQSVDQLATKFLSTGNLSKTELSGGLSNLVGLLQTELASSAKTGLVSGIKSVLSGGDFLTAFNSSSTQTSSGFLNFATSSLGSSLGLSQTPNYLSANSIGLGSGGFKTPTGVFGDLQTSSYFATNQLTTFGQAVSDSLPYLNAVAQLGQGNVGAAAGSALGAYFGGPLAPVTSIIGQYVGSLVDKAFSGESRAGGRYVYKDGAAQLSSGPSGGEIQGDTIKADINSAVSNINSLLLRLGSTAKVSGFQGGLESSGNGRGGVYSGGTLSTGATFGESGSGSNYLGTLYESQTNSTISATEALKAFNLDLLQVQVQALQAANVGGLLGEKIAALGDAEKLNANQIESFLSDIDALRSLSDTLSKLPLENLKSLSLEATNNLVTFSGGFDKLSSNLTAYYDKTFTAEDKRKQAATVIAETLNSVGVYVSSAEVLRASTKQFKDLVDAIDVSTAEGAKQVATLYAVADSFSAVQESTSSTLKAFDELTSTPEDKLAAVVARVGEKLSAAGINIPASAIRSATAKDYKDLVNGVDTSTAEGKLAVEALLSVVEDMSTVFSKTTEIANERSGLMSTLYGLVDNTTAQRIQELQKLDSSNQALQVRIYKLQDEKKLADEQNSLENEYLSASGNIIESRNKELSAINSVNRSLKIATYILESTKAVADAVKNVDSAQASVVSLQRNATSNYLSALESVKTATQAVKDANSEIAKSYIDAATSVKDFISEAIVDTYQKVLAKARGGDLEAAKKLPGLAQTELDRLKSVSATASDYALAKARMYAELNQVQLTLASKGSAYEEKSQLVTATTSLSEANDKLAQALDVLSGIASIDSSVTLDYLKTALSDTALSDYKKALLAKDDAVAELTKQQEALDAIKSNTSNTVTAIDNKLWELDAEQTYKAILEIADSSDPTAKRVLLDGAGTYQTTLDAIKKSGLDETSGLYKAVVSGYGTYATSLTELKASGLDPSSQLYKSIVLGYGTYTAALSNVVLGSGLSEETKRIIIAGSGAYTSVLKSLDLTKVSELDKKILVSGGGDYLTTLKVAADAVVGSSAPDWLRSVYVSGGSKFISTVQAAWSGSVDPGIKAFITELGATALKSVNLVANLSKDSGLSQNSLESLFDATAGAINKELNLAMADGSLSASELSVLTDLLNSSDYITKTFSARFSGATSDSLALSLLDAKNSSVVTSVSADVGYVNSSAVNLLNASSSSVVKSVDVTKGYVDAEAASLLAMTGGNSKVNITLEKFSSDSMLSYSKAEVAAVYNAIALSTKDTAYNTARLVTKLAAGSPQDRSTGYALGGYTGDGGVYQEAGVVHKGEFVWSQADIARFGGVQAVDRLRVNGFAEQPLVAINNPTDIMPVVDELRLLRVEVRAVAEHSAKTRKILERVTSYGEAMRTTAV